MKKILLLLTAILVFLFSTRSVHAVLPGYSQVCFSDMARSPKVTSNPKAGFGTNSLKLSVGGINATKAYISFCKAGGKECSTGNAEYDAAVEIGSEARRKDVQVKYRVTTANDTGMTNTLVDVIGGRIDNLVVWINQPGNHVDHYIYAFYSNTPTTTGDSGQGAGSNATLQNGDLLFSRPVIVPVNKKCARLAWDPFGRIFDSQTLEPIGGVMARVLSKLSPEKLADSFDQNPQETYSNGTYEVRVAEGNYYVRLKNIPTGYTFTKDAVLASNYSKIYQAEDGTPRIYKPDEVIPELIDTPEEILAGAPEPEQRDIPLDTKGTRLNRPAYFFSKEAEKDGVREDLKGINVVQFPTANGVQFTGSVTHPFAAIKALSVSATGEKTEIDRTYADRKGDFNFELLVEKYLSDTTLVNLEVEKIDLTKELPALQTRNSPWGSKIAAFIEYISNKIVGTVMAEGATSKSFQVIPRYLSGYAYDSNNKVLPYTRVRTILEVNGTAYSETMTDEKGYFFFPVSEIPFNEYHVEFYPGDTLEKGIKKQMSSFLKENATYLKASKLNLMNVKTVQLAPTTSITAPPLKPTVKIVQKGVSSRTGREQQANTTQSMMQNGANSPYLIIGAIVVLLVIAGVVGFALYKKNTSSPSGPAF